jgi:hypothetical protein
MNGERQPGGSPMGERRNEDDGRPRSEEASVTLICGHCGRHLEWCSFCDRSDCPDASCLTCLVIALHESMGPLHTHGG